MWQFISTKTFSQIEKVNFSSLQKMERKLISSPCKTSVMKLFISLFVKLFQLALFTGFLGYMVFNHANAAQFFRFPVGGHFDVGKVLFVNLFAFVVSKLAVMMAVQFRSPAIGINLCAFPLGGAIECPNPGTMFLGIFFCNLRLSWAAACSHRPDATHTCTYWIWEPV